MVTYGRAMSIQSEEGGGFESWFHGIISRVDAEKLLKKMTPGAYLVRVAETYVSGASLKRSALDGIVCVLCTSMGSVMCMHAQET